MKICQYAFGGHCKDIEAGASSEGYPQTNAFTGEGIKPWALKVRVGLNCAALLKYSRSTFFSPLHFPDASDWIGCMLEKKIHSLFIEVVGRRHFLRLLRCKYLYQAEESP